MPPMEGIVEIPLSALAEDGRLSFVFVQTDPDKFEYKMRRVQVVRRFEETAYVRSELTAEDRKLNAEEEQFKITNGAVDSLRANKVADDAAGEVEGQGDGSPRKEFKSQADSGSALSKILDKNETIVTSAACWESWNWVRRRSDLASEKDQILKEKF